jgi:hypothetical protein
MPIAVAVVVLALSLVGGVLSFVGRNRQGFVRIAGAATPVIVALSVRGPESTVGYVRWAAVAVTLLLVGLQFVVLRHRNGADGAIQPNRFALDSLCGSLPVVRQPERDPLRLPEP